MSRIALDALGGDRAPVETVAGAMDAAAHGVDVVLVGDRERVSSELDRLGVNLPIVHAPDVISMGEDPARAIREKPDSSVVRCARLVRDGEAAGFVSAGSTGAAMAAAAVIVGRSPGVLKPTIASVFPTEPTPTVVLDSGANPEVKPEHLVQFAIMGSLVSTVYHGVATPRVGLLNNGEEPSKGRALEKAAHQMLSVAPICFSGNVEGRDIADNKVDVIVTDGFTGNIFLKTTEGTAQWLTRMVLDAVGRLDPDVQAEVMPGLTGIRKRTDYEQTGGAHLVGVKGVVVIAHGASSRVAIANALRMAEEGADRDLVGMVTRRLAAG